MKAEDVMLSEIRQSQKVTCCTIPLTRAVRTGHTHRSGTELAAARGGDAGMWGPRLDGTKPQLRGLSPLQDPALRDGAVHLKTHTEARSRAGRPSRQNQTEAQPAEEHKEGLRGGDDRRLGTSMALLVSRRCAYVQTRRGVPMQYVTFLVH